MLVFLIDGMADQEGERSALEVAETPNLDRLHGWGKGGWYFPVGREIAPERDQALLWCLGNDLAETYPGRGVLEATGSDVAYTAGELVARVDLAVYEDGKITGFRPEHRMEHVSKLTHPEVRDVLWKITPISEWEGVLVVRFPFSASDAITGNYPGVKEVDGLLTSKYPFTAEGYREFGPRNTSMEAIHGAALLNKLFGQINRTGEAEGWRLVARGFSTEFPEFKQWTGWCLFSNSSVDRGVGELSGMGVGKVSKKNILSALAEKQHVIVVVHEPNRMSLEGDLEGKVRSIEKVDGIIGELNERVHQIMVGSLRGTKVGNKTVGAIKNPVLWWMEGMGKGGGVKKFSERSVRDKKIRPWEIFEKARVER